MLILLPSFILIFISAYLLGYAYSNRFFRFMRLITLGLTLAGFLVVLLLYRLGESQVSILESSPGGYPLFGFISDSASIQLSAMVCIVGFISGLLYMQLNNREQILGWAGIYLINGLVLLAVFSGSLFTLLLMWTGLDLTALLISLRKSKSEDLEKALWLDVGIKILSTILLAGLGVTNSPQGLHGFFNNSDPYSLIILIPLALRMGLIPITSEINQRIYEPGIGHTLKLSFFASSAIIISRIGLNAQAGPEFNSFLIVLMMSAISGAVEFFRRQHQQSMIDGWLRAGAVFVLAAGLFSVPEASLNWAALIINIAAVLILLNLPEMKIRYLASMIVLTILALPFTPFQNINLLYSPGEISWAWIFIIPQSLLGFGLVKQFFLAQNLQEEDTWPDDPVESVSAFFLISLPWLLMFVNGIPTLNPQDFIASGILILLIGAYFWIFIRLKFTNALLIGAVGSVFSFGWLRTSAEIVFRMLSNAVRFSEKVLEEEGGLLWIIMLVLIFIISIGEAAGF